MSRARALLESLRVLLEGSWTTLARQLDTAVRKEDEASYAAAQKVLDLGYEILKVANRTLEDFADVMSNQRRSFDAYDFVEFTAGDSFTSEKWDTLRKGLKKLKKEVDERDEWAHNFFATVVRLDQELPGHSAKSQSDPTRRDRALSAALSVLYYVKTMDQLILEIDDLTGDLNLDDIPSAMAEYRAAKDAA